jgi:zinc finger CCHC domain-containing protein 9
LFTNKINKTQNLYATQFLPGYKNLVFQLRMTRYTKFKKSFNPSTVSTGKVQKPSFNESKSSHRGSGYVSDSASKSLNCLKCRMPGHKMRECPSNKIEQVFCYNCGEADHSTKQCPMPFSNYAHALCFLCDLKGHLASACPKNDRGVYPNGGCCHYCGSIKHLARNCRPTQSANNGNEIIISASMTAGTNPEIDDVHEALQKIQQNFSHSTRTSNNSDEAIIDEKSENNVRKEVIKKKSKKVVTF